jgi:hypothetical protein
MTKESNPEFDEQRLNEDKEAWCRIYVHVWSDLTKGVYDKEVIDKAADEHWQEVRAAIRCKSPQSNSPSRQLQSSGAYSVSKSFMNAKAKRRQYKRTASEADKVQG